MDLTTLLIFITLVLLLAGEIGSTVVGMYVKVASTATDSGSRKASNQAIAQVCAISSPQRGSMSEMEILHQFIPTSRTYNQKRLGGSTWRLK